MENEEKQVILPHFTTEEVEALKREHERRERVFKGHALLNNDDERLRDAHQREGYWRIQIEHLVQHDMEHSPDMRHAEEELGHTLFTQGKIDEALALTESPERRAYYLSIHAAIIKGDDKTCDCPKAVDVEFVDPADGQRKKASNATMHVVGQMPSFKHGGLMTPIRKCTLCGHTNITNE